MPLSRRTAQQAAIALGSNLGDSRATLEQALVVLDRTAGVRLLSHSSWYSTKPVGPVQPDYLNGCALLEVTLSAEALLELLLATENRFGRVRSERWGARTLDLDLLLYGQLRLDTPRLQLPHPRLRERAFMLLPLLEIAPTWIDPLTGSTISKLVQALDNVDGVKRLEENP